MRISLLFLAAVLLLTLSGCGKEPAPTTSTTTAATEATVETTAATTAPAFPRAGYVNGDSLRVRATPGTDKDPIGGVKFGDRLTLLGQEGDWFLIEFSGAAQAYVSAQFVQDTPPIAGEATSETAEATTAQE